MNELLIKKLSVRDRLTDDEKEALENAPIRLAEIGRVKDIVHEGRQATESCLLLDGWAARYNVLRGGERQITAFHVPGDFVDLHSLLLDPMDHSIVALTDCRCAFFPHAYLRQITEQHPHLTRVLWLNTLIDSATHRQWLVAMGRRSAEAHMAHLFCELYIRLEVVSLASDFRFHLPLTQADIGDAMGLSGVHVNRTLRSLREAGLLTWRGGEVAILDWKGLVATAEFDPVYLNIQRRPR